jgi:hypothetical protein
MVAVTFSRIRSMLNPSVSTFFARVYSVKCLLWVKLEIIAGDDNVGRFLQKQTSSALAGLEGA